MLRTERGQQPSGSSNSQDRKQRNPQHCAQAQSLSVQTVTQSRPESKPVTPMNEAAT